MKRFITCICLCSLFSCAIIKKKSNQVGKDQTIIINEIKNYQQDLNDKYSNPLTSPLKEKATDFKGHSFFPIDLDYRVVAQFTPLKDQPFFNIETSGPKNPAYRKFGYLTFSLQGKSYQLTLLQNRNNMRNPLYRDHLFLAFTDLTSGESTYGGGRYMDLKIPTKEKIIVDFNKSYNPYCAYTTGYSCPVPPEENFLEVAIEAGIKLEVTGGY